MYGLLAADEDTYWERRREEWERDRSVGVLEYEEGSLFLDEETEQIEFATGYKMADLDEDDLLDIVAEMEGITAETAAWNGRFGCIDYKYRVA